MDNESNQEIVINTDGIEVTNGKLSITLGNSRVVISKESIMCEFQK